MNLPRILRGTFSQASIFVLCFLTALLLLPTSVSAQSFTFTASGDFGLNTAAPSVIAQMGANSDFGLALGDLAYSSNGQGFCDMVTNATSATYPFEIVAGNHDTGEGDPNIMPTVVNCLPHRAGSAITGTYGHTYYFDYPATNPLARFIMIRPGVKGVGEISYNVGGAGYTFTQNAIDSARSSGIKWIVVGFHKNYISAMEKPNEVGNDIMNLLFTKKVDLILQGHEHGYERSKQLSCATTGSYNASCVVDSDNSLTKGLGSVIIVLGTGGRSFRGQNTGDPEFPYFAKLDGTSQSHGSGKFTVSSSAIDYEYIRIAGNLTDTFTISDCPTCPTPTLAPTSTPAPGPDLIVTDVGWSPANPTVGTPVTFNATIQNQGNLATPNGAIHGVRFHIDGVPDNWSDTYTTSIPPGSSVTVTANGNPQGSATWTATAGTHTITALVDDVNRIIENNENNNTLNKTLTVSTGPTPTPTSTAPTPTGSAPSPTPTPGGCPALPTGVAMVTTTATVQTAGTYTVWSRINPPNTSNNEYWLQIEDQCPVNVGGGTIPQNTWAWIDYQNATTSQKVSANLTAGDHIVRVVEKDPGVKLDKIMLLSSSCVPTGTGTNCAVQPTVTIAPSQTPTPTAAGPTPTSNPNQSVVFTAGGDHGAPGQIDTRTSLQFIKNNNAVFHLALGDMSYSDAGTEPTNGTTPSPWCTGTDPNKNIKLIVGDTFPFQLVTGNHEEDGGPDGFIMNFAQCLPDRMNSVGTYPTQYYFDYPQSNPLMRVIMISPGLDVNGTRYDYNSGSNRTWLTNSIDSARSANIPWVVVGMHKTCITTGNKPCEIGQATMDLLLQKKVDLIVQAHDHDYQRSKQLTCATAGSYNSTCVIDDGSDNLYTKGQGSVIVINGAFGGGGFTSISTSDNEKDYFSKAMGGNGGFDIVRNTTFPGAGRGVSKYTVSPTSLTGEFLMSNQDVPGTPVFTDTFTITADPNQPTSTPQPSSAATPTSPAATNTPTPTTATTTPTPLPGGGQVFTPTEDSYVEENDPTKNNGSNTQLRVDGSPKLYAYMKFTVQGLSAPVTNATLRIFTNSNHSQGFTVHRVSNNTWTESGITYSNAPGFDPASLGTSGALSSNNWYSIDVTQYITGNGTYSFALDTPSTTAMSLASRESANQPQLIVTTSTAAPTATPTRTPTPLPSATTTAVPPTTTITLTPTPQQLVGDFNQDGSVDLLDFNIWRDEFLGNLTTKLSDINLDGNVDLLDFNLWLQSFKG